jgi:Mg/Co/Ni transporter MgtE
VYDTQYGANTAKRDQDSRVEDEMRREFETVDAAEMLDTAFRRFQTCQCETLPVLRGGALVGLVSLDNVGEFVAVQAALESAQASRRKVHAGRNEVA